MAKDGVSRSQIQTLVLLTGTGLGIYICFRMAAPFVSSLVWALALAVLLAPLQRWLESKLKRPGLAALICALLVGLGVVLIATFVGQRLVIESVKGADIIRAKVESGEWRKAIETQPRLAPVAEWLEKQLDLAGIVKTLAAWLTTAAGSVLKGSLVPLIEFGLSLYLFFYFVRDRQSALRSVRSMVPLSRPEMDHVSVRVADSIRAIVYGTLTVSALQGLLGGLMFWWLGLPAALVWGVMMALLAIVPVLGAFVVWIPAAIFLALEGSWGKALILVLWGLFVVGTVDNLLRPILVGNRLKLHTVLVFLSVVGGLLLFGTCGLILGPVVLTITTELLEIWHKRVAREAKAHEAPDVDSAA